MPGDDGQAGGQVFADFGRISEAPDLIDALRQTRYVHRGEILGNLLASDPAGEYEAGTEHRAGSGSQPRPPVAITNDKRHRIPALH